VKPISARASWTGLASNSKTEPALEGCIAAKLDGELPVLTL